MCGDAWPLTVCSSCAAPSSDTGSSGRGDSKALLAPGDFLLEQFHADTLHSAFDQWIKIDGHMVHPDAALTYQHFVLISDRLHRVSHDIPSCWFLKAARK